MQDNKRISVLLVEDSEDDALLTVMELRGGGYEPSFERVETPEDMESALEEKQWDLIISDFSLPHFNGFDALKLYKEKELDIPFIVVSGAIGEETAIGLMHEGAHDYIMKDNLARLVPAVQREIRDAGIRAERRQAAKALEKSETRYRMLAENVADLIWTTDLKLKMTYITPSIIQVLGYSNDEAMALPLKEFLTRNSFRKLIRLYRAHIAGEKAPDLDRDVTVGVELELVRKDGSVFWTESKMAFLKNDDGIPVGIIGVVRDIDALKKSESVLRENEQRFRELSNQFTTLLDAIPDPLMLISRDRKILWANISATDAFDLDVGANPNCNSLWHMSEPECRGCPVAKSFKSGLEESDVLTTEDNRFWDIRAFPIKDDDENVINVIELAIDITEKRKLQAERMRAAHLASLGELAAGVAHEINNPNAGIILNTQLLVDDQDMASGERAGILGRIIGNSERIDRIVSKLLSFARTDSEERQSVDVIEIINEVHALIAMRFEKSGLKLVLNLPGDLPRIWAHPQQMEQIFMNLCTNSLHAMKNFDPQSEREMCLEITGGTKDMDGKTYVQVVLHDNGSGISENIMDRVLDPFFTTKPKGQGTGLGLSISHEIIMNHEGNMELESVEGAFTKITVSIPVMEMEHEA